MNRISFASFKVQTLMPSLSEHFVLVFWPEENAVTTVAEGNIVSTNLRIGESCQVKIGKKTYVHRTNRINW